MRTAVALGCMAALAGAGCAGPPLPVRPAHDLTIDCPADAAGLLRRFAGSWRVRLANRAGPDRFETSTGRSSIEIDSAHCMLVERLTAAGGRGPVHFLWMTTFGAGGSAERIHLDSEHKRFLLFEGSWSEGSATFSRTREWSGGAATLRTVIAFTGPDRFTAETTVLPQAAEAQTVQRLEYRR